MIYTHIINRILLFSIVITLFLECGHTTVIGDEKGNTALSDQISITPTIAKWFDNHTAAASINFDIPVSVCKDAIYATLHRSLTVDVEMVSSAYIQKDKGVFRDLESFSAQGVHFFGHGHRHEITYDSVSYDLALAEFDTCYRLMQEWRLSPLAYAYPGGSGRLAKTQKAAADAGFLCGRSTQGNKDSLFICADDRREPEKWFCLPAACIGNIEGFFRNHAEMVDLFNNNLLKKSWVIPMYHSLGFVNGYASYPMEDFLNDLDYLRSSDTWVANMDVVARYIMERNNCMISCVVADASDKDVVVETVIRDTATTSFELVPLTISMEINGDRPFNRCEVVDNKGAATIYRIIEKRFSMNAIPDGNSVRMRFFWITEN